MHTKKVNQDRRYRSKRRRRGLTPSTISDPTDVPQINVGKSLRDLREERDLTIRTLSEMSGLNVNTLSLIENGKSSPSVNTLQRLALALDVPIVAFFEHGKPQNNVTHLKAENRPTANFTHGTVEDLGMGIKGCPFEAMVVEVTPHAGSGDTPIVHTGFELVFCLQGEIIYQVADQQFVLESGDSLFFEAHLPHRWDNVMRNPARAILVMCPADERDRPAERHFLEGEL